MEKIAILLSLFFLFIGCGKKNPKPGEVSARILRFTVVDDFTGKSTCSGYEIEIEGKDYQAIGDIPARFADPNAWPASVFVRYSRDKKDPCTQRSNRIVISSMREI